MDAIGFELTIDKRDLGSPPSGSFIASSQAAFTVADMLRDNDPLLSLLFDFFDPDDVTYEDITEEDLSTYDLERMFKRSE